MPSRPETWRFSSHWLPCANRLLKKMWIPTTENANDRLFMRKALRLAEKGRGFTSPNPMVGALVVRGDTVVGEGCHAFAGGPHAEINALRIAGDKAFGASLYVTLEPCNHFGRTPPCTGAILESGVSRVVVGMSDPNPLVQGGGCGFLREKGLKVDAGVLERECRVLNQAFIKHVTTGLPHVTLKAAMTLDGRIAARSGESRWISNDRSRLFVHRLRCSLDAILVGVETALTDDPLLTARMGPRTRCRQPVRIVLDSMLRLSPESQLVGTTNESPVWVACAGGASSEKETRLKEAGVEVLRLPSSNRQVDLPSLLKVLGTRNITSLLVEGGSRVLGAFVEQGLADEFYFFYAPKILADPEAVPVARGEAKGSVAEAFAVHDVRVRRFRQDVMLHGRFREQLF